MQEIGLRAALGASRGDIVGLIARQGFGLTAAGAAIGLAGAAGLSRVLDALLFRISPLDPPTYAGVAMVIAATAALTCAIPAWRAARVDPVSTLRAG
jgi:ABC-type antimicrobial peptide transport system permease subunit